MTDFVRDNLATPGGKSNARANTDPPEKSYTAAEWNKLCAFLESLRTRVKLDQIHVDDYGAVGDDSTDDTVALQNAFNAAVLVGGTVRLTPGKFYKTTAEILVTGGKTVRVWGGNGLDCGIRCVTPNVRAVLAVVNQQVHVDGLMLKAERAAKYCVYLESSGSTTFDRCRFYQATVDAIHLEADCDACVFDKCLIELCGTLYATSGYDGNSPLNIRTAVTGTITKTSGYSPTLELVGSDHDFVTMGVRVGDMVSTHATAPGGRSAEWLAVASIDSPTQITCYGLSGGAASGLKFTVHVGDGYHEGPGRADVNLNQLNRVTVRNCANFGVRCQGLYGLSSTNLQSDFNGSFPVGIGSNGLVSIGSTWIRNYFEGNGAGDCFLVGYAADVMIIQNNGAGAPVGLVPGQAWGLVLGRQNAGDAGRVDPIGSMEVDHVPSAVLVADAVSRGKIWGTNYGHNAASSFTGLTMTDFASGLPWLAESFLEPGGEQANAVAFGFDASAGESFATGKKLVRVRRGGTEKFALGLEGDTRQPFTDSSGTPGAATIDKPRGRSAIAAGASSVTITNKLCVAASSQIVITMRANDATGLKPIAIAADGSFTVTVSASCTAALAFDWLVVN